MLPEEKYSSSKKDKKIQETSANIAHITQAKTHIYIEYRHSHTCIGHTKTSDDKLLIITFQVTAAMKRISKKHKHNK